MSREYSADKLIYRGGGDAMSKKTYFQYQKDLNLPIYISVDLTTMDAGFAEFLNKMKFFKLSDKEESEALTKLKKNNLARILNVTEASLLVSKQIHANMESDRYGAESVIPKDGYRLYRYKDVGLMIYSFAAKEWQMGCFNDFGSAQNFIASKIILNRFLTWALVPHGVIGLWGVTVDDGMVAQRVIESKGEAVFIDVRNLQMITQDGVKKMRSHFKILRLDPTLKGRNVKMKSEELLSFISAHCSYMDSAGLSVPVRQMIQALSRMTEGLLHPQESFRPRTDLSL